MPLKVADFEKGVMPQQWGEARYDSLPAWLDAFTPWGGLVHEPSLDLPGILVFRFAGDGDGKDKLYAVQLPDDCVLVNPVASPRFLPVPEATTGDC